MASHTQSAAKADTPILYGVRFRLVDMDPLSYNTTLDHNLRAAQRVPVIRELLISLTALDSISVTTLLKFEL
jgi:hypothetical protein